MRTFLIVLFFTSLNIFSLPDTSFVYTTERLEVEPIIDGNINDKCWEKGTWESNFTQREPKAKEKPSQETKFKVLYNDKYIYVAVICTDNDPKNIVKMPGRRNEYNGDMAGIAFDSFDDNRTAFEFGVTSAGVKLDLTISEDGNEIVRNMNWDPIWDVKIGDIPNGWTIEMKIPFDQIKFPNKDDMKWGMLIWRWNHNRVEEDIWPYVPITAKNHIPHYAVLQGFKGVKPGLQFEFMPYISGKFSKNPVSDNPLFNKTEKSFDIGLDGKLSLGTNFNVEYTINPDFGQTEADPSSLNLTVYETFYEEKRQFFKEGVNVLTFDIDDNTKMFYSRRIGQTVDKGFNHPNADLFKMPNNSKILGAIKLNGATSDNLNIGFISALTSEENADFIVDGDKRKVVVEPMANYSILRLQKQLSNSQTIGVIATNTKRDAKGEVGQLFYDNSFTGGLDYQKMWNNNTYFFTAKSIFSNISGSKSAISRLQKSEPHNFLRDSKQVKYDSSRTSLTGAGGMLSIGKTNTLWTYKTSLVMLSPELELNDIGYMTKSDNIYLLSNINYDNNNKTKYYRQLTLDLTAKNSLDFSPNPTGFDVTGSLYAKFLNYYGAKLLLMGSSSNMDNYMLNGGPAIRVSDNLKTQIYLHSDTRKKISAELTSDYTIFNDDKSYKFNISPIVTWRVVNNLTFSMSGNYDNSINDMQYVANSGGKFICGSLKRESYSATFRINCNLFPELNIQYYMQPYMTSGEYDNFKFVSDTPTNGEYKKRFIPYASDYDEKTNKYSLKYSDKNSPEIDNPDFTLRSLNSNFVIKWDYSQGSSLYLVWSNSGMSYDSHSDFSAKNHVNNVFDLTSTNVLMFKLNYWFKL